MALILAILSLIPVISFVYLTIGSAMSVSAGANEADIFSSVLGNFIIPLLIMAIVWLALFLPSLAMAVRRYRDAGLRGRGFLVLWIISVASSYTEIMRPLQQTSGSAVFTFLTYAIGLLFFVITVFPTNAITTKSNNEFICFFLRSKKEV